MESTTKRYKITGEGLSESGPGSYESVYLTSEGSPASDELYKVLDAFEGGLLPASGRVIRQRNGEDLEMVLMKKTKQPVKEQPLDVKEVDETDEKPEGVTSRLNEC